MTRHPLTALVPLPASFEPDGGTAECSGQLFWTHCRKSWVPRVDGGTKEVRKAFSPSWKRDHSVPDLVVGGCDIIGTPNLVAGGRVGGGQLDRGVGAGGAGQRSGICCSI